MSWIKEKSKEEILELSKNIENRENMYYYTKLIWQNTVIIELLVDIRDELKNR